jgi:hypothetical protein
VLILRFFIADGAFPSLERRKTTGAVEELSVALSGCSTLGAE